MTDSVDNRVVYMKFDNVAFESKMSETIKSLDKLRASLDFSSSKRNLSELSNVGKNFTMGDMGRTVEGISNKFSALGVIGITALATITSKAVSAGEQMAKSLTLGPLMQGFQEYELKIGAIQTIMAGSGESLKVVTSALAELNTYADRTIYSFADMTGNIGKFTNAGVSLKDSVAAIKGISNVAAISGANAEEASRAMYNFSQALAQGSVKLIDWKSINLANMGTKEFKQQLIDTAVSMGTLTKTTTGFITKKGTFVSATKGFEQSLTDEWLTADALVGTLGRYSDATTSIGKRATAAAQDVKTFTQMLSTVKESAGSAWASVFETLFGDIEHAKKLWTALNTTIGNFVTGPINALNKLLTGWKSLGGGILVIQGIKNVFAGIAAFLKPIKEAFKDIFPPMTAKRLFDLSMSFYEFTKKLKMGVDTIDKIKRTFRGFFAIVEIGKEILKGIFNVVKDVFAALLPVGSSLLDFGANSGDLLTNLNNALVAGGGIRDFFERLSDAITKPIAFLIQLKDAVAKFFNMDLGDNRVTDRLDSISNSAKGISGAWDQLKAEFQGIFDILNKVWDHIATWFSDLGKNIAKAIKTGDFNAALDVINTGLLAGIVLLLKKFLSGGLKLDFGGGFFAQINKTLTGLTGTLTAMQTKLKADALLKIAIAVGVLAAAVGLLSLIDSKAMTRALVALSVGFAQLVSSMALINLLTSGYKSAATFQMIAAGMILLAAAMVVLAIAMKIFATMSWEDIGKGLAGVGGGLLVIGGAMQAMPNGGKMILQSIGLIAVGAALNLIATSMKIFATMSWTEIGKGLAGIGFGLAAIAGAMQAMPNGVNLVLQSAGLIAIGVALNLIAASMKVFATMSWEDIGKGLAGVGGGLLAIAGATRLMPLGPNLVLQAAGLVAIGVALNLIATSMKLFATMSWEDMAKGLAGVGVGLAVIAGAMRLMPLSIPITAAGVLILSVALNVLAVAVRTMGHGDFKTLAKGIGSFAIMLGVLALAVNAMNGALLGAIALTVVSGALVVLTYALKQLAVLNISQIAIGLGAIAGIFLIIGLAGLVLQPLVPTLLGLGAALALIGASFALFGVGALLVSQAFEIMSEAGEKGAKAIVGAIKILLTALPGFAKEVAKSIISLAEELIKAMPLMIRLMQAVLEQLLKTVVKETPKIAEAFGVIISSALELIRQKAPEAISVGLSVLLAFLKGIRDNIGEITAVVVDIITGFLDALALKVPQIIDSVYNLVTAIIKGVALKLVDVGKVLIPKGLELLGGLLLGIAQKAPEVMRWFVSLPGKIIGWLGDLAGKLIPKGLSLLGGLLTGMINKLVDIGTWLYGLPGRLLGMVADLGSVLLDTGKAVIQGLWDGMQAGWHHVTQWLSKLNPANWFNDINPYKGHAIKNLVSTGSAVMMGLHNGMKGEWSNITDWLQTLNPADSFNPEPIVSKLQNSLLQIPKSLADLEDFNPTITPVLDLTNLKRAAGDIGKYMPTSTLSPEVSLQQAKVISSATMPSKVDTGVLGKAETIEMKFEQIINAPHALSTADIYRGTRSQIALAKEKLDIK